MSVVNLTNVVVHNNPCPFGAEFQFEIEFGVLGCMEDEIEWKLTYIGSVDSPQEYDQVVDSVVLDPMNPGGYKILFNSDPPNLALIPPSEVLGVTGLLLAAEYRALQPSPPRNARTHARSLARGATDATPLALAACRRSVLRPGRLLRPRRVRHRSAQRGAAGAAHSGETHQDDCSGCAPGDAVRDRLVDAGRAALLGVAGGRRAAALSHRDHGRGRHGERRGGHSGAAAVADGGGGATFAAADAP